MFEPEGKQESGKSKKKHISLYLQQWVLKIPKPASPIPDKGNGHNLSLSNKESQDR